MSEKKKMAAHGGKTEDPGELEDLQMIFSLADDADEEFMEDVMLKEAEPFEVKEITSVLQRLSSSCEERELTFAFEILSKTEKISLISIELPNHTPYSHRMSTSRNADGAENANEA